MRIDKRSSTRMAWVESAALRRLPTIASLAAMLVGGMALAGWALGLPAFTHILPALPVMIPNTALGLALAGLALLLMPAAARARGSLVHLLPGVAALLVALLGLLTLAEYLVGVDLGLDRALFAEATSRVQAAFPGRPAPGTALNFLLLGAALLILATGAHTWIAQLLGAIVGLNALRALVGYAVGAVSLYAIAPNTSMALHTALCFLLLCAGVLAYSGDRSLVELLASGCLGGLMLRRLLLAAIVIPIGVELALVISQRAALFGFGFDILLLIAVNLFVFVLLARSLERQDQARQRAEQAAQAAKTELEERVAARTAELYIANQRLQRELEERQRAEHELHTLAHQQRTILSALPDSVWLTDTVGRIIIVNDAFGRFYGRPPSELVGRTAWDLLPPELAAATRAEDDDVMRTGQQRSERQMTSKIGQSGWYDIIKCPVYDGQGTVLGLVGVARDTTARRQAETALSASEEKFRILFDILPAGVSIIDSQHKIIEHNSALKSILKLSDDALERRAYQQRGYLAADGAPMPPDKFPSAQAIDQQRVVHDVEIGVVIDERELIWTSVSAAPIPIAGLGAVVVTVDITERKRAETALRASQSRLAGILDIADDAIIAVNERREIELFNQGAERIFGYTAAQMIGRSLDMLLPADLVAVHHQHIADFAGSGSAARRMGERRDIRGKRCDGAEFPAEASISRLKVDGELIFTTILRDITAQKQAEARLRASLHEKEILLQEIHHRVKNNLQLVTSLLRLQAANISDPAVQALFRDSQNRVRAMALVHEQLYRNQDLGHVDFASYARELAASVLRSYEAQAGRVALVFDFDPSVPLSINMVIPLGLILTELVANCLKHAFRDGRAGTITLGLRAGVDRILLEVRDDGVGMPADFKVATSGSLGLQLVFDLADQLGGDVEIEPGNGTLFRVRTPR